MALPIALINQTPNEIGIVDLGIFVPPGSGTILDLTGLYLIEEVRDSSDLEEHTVISGSIVISGSEGVLNSAAAARFFTGSQIAEQNFTTEGIDLRDLRNVIVAEGDNIVVTSGEVNQTLVFTVGTSSNVVSDALVGAGNVTIVSGTDTITVSGGTGLTGALHQIAFMKGKDDIMNDLFLNTYGDGMDGSPSNDSPAVMPWKSKLVGLTYTNKTAGTKVHIEIQSTADGTGNSPVLMDFDWLLDTVGVRTARKTDFVTDIIFDAGDKISVFLDLRPGSSRPRNVIVILYFEIVEATFEESSENFSGNLGPGVTT